MSSTDDTLGESWLVVFKHRQDKSGNNRLFATRLQGHELMMNYVHIMASQGIGIPENPENR